MMREHISSYRDLPVYAYQFQTKLRNETRAKSGIMRTREFIMKDLYSFSRSEAEHTQFYEQAKQAYTKTFDRLGLGEWTYLTYASGGAFAEFSHEFQTVTAAGEDIIYIDHDQRIAINQEVYSDKLISELGLDKAKLEKTEAAEVGNIFNLGTSKSQPLGLVFNDKDGKQKPVIMGSYGIGPARVMGVVVERYADEHGMVWPEAIAPAKVYLIQIGSDNEVVTAAEKLYADLQQQGIEVLYDDRDESAGAKFADADLMGCPVRLTISPKTLEKGSVERKNRTEADSRLVALDNLQI